MSECETLFSYTLHVEHQVLLGTRLIYPNHFLTSVYSDPDESKSIACQRFWVQLLNSKHMRRSLHTVSVWWDSWEILGFFKALHAKKAWMPIALNLTLERPLRLIRRIKTILMLQPVRARTTDKEQNLSNMEWVYIRCFVNFFPVGLELRDLILLVLLENSPSHPNTWQFCK